MSSIKLPHSSGNSMSIAAPATNPASDLTLQLPNSVGTGKINHGNVLEQFCTPCDGSAITVPSGTYTVTDVSAIQDLSSSYADITGSSIAYTPPAGTTQVIYEYDFEFGRASSNAQGLIKIFLDSDEVTKGYRSHGNDASSTRCVVRWAFNIGGSADTTVGRVASWTSAKTIKLQARDLSGSYQVHLHSTPHESDGGSTDTFSMPLIQITAIGTPA